MKKLPSSESGAFSVADVVNIIYIGLLWLVCCLPVLTIGPASSAMYHSIVKSVRRGRGQADKTFFAAFKANFRCGFKAWLVFLGLILLWLMSAIIRSSADPEGIRMMSRLSLLLILPVCYPLPWVFAYISRFDNSLKDSLKYSLYLSLRNPGRSIVLLLIPAGFAVLGSLAPVLIPLLPGFCCLAMSFFIEPVFRTITEKMDTDSNADKWYNE